ncbi:MAG: invasion associated locus B family protein [Geminicoccaceae bacterium]
MTRTALTMLLALVAMLAVSSTPLLAQEDDATPRFVDSHQDWNVYTVTQDERQICYIASIPEKEEGDYTRRGNVALLVTRLNGGSPRDEVSVQAGYTYDKARDVVVTVDGGRKFNLFAVDGHAWAKTDEDDKGLIDAMKRGAQLVVRGRSSRGTDTTDTYSLLGFTNAYGQMLKECSS